MLRLSVRIFSRTRREEAAELLERHGFRRSGQPQSYRHTLTVDLTPDESAILGGFHKTARKNLRSAQQSPLCLRTLTDERYADRIKELQDESMRRTGKCHNRVNWRSILQLSRACPGLSRIDGLFLSEDDLDPARLVAFGWGSIQGDHGAYCAAGTARLPLLKAPLSYPVLWDLMTWAKRQGASWFDMGGVTLGGSETDPLKGISDFKRYFSRTVEEVSDEWTLELRPLRSRLAAALGNGVHGISEPFTRAGMNRLAKASRTL